MHFMCHKKNEFLPTDFNLFSHHPKNELDKISECVQKMSIPIFSRFPKFLDFV